MTKLLIKPLSVNECWQGKRFKTSKYERYERNVMIQLPRIDIPDGELSITIHYGFSNANADIDNPCKPFLDILQKKYGFNDSRIYKLNQVKTLVSKGFEFIEFTIEKNI